VARDPVLLRVVVVAYGAAMSDAVFFLKATPTKVEGLPPDTKVIGLDPVAMGLGCGGEDPYCSTAYANMWGALGGKGGVMPTLRKKYGVTGRVAFVSFSAGHGFMNPLLSNDADRNDVSAVLLLDSTFGGGKTGYVKAAIDAAYGKRLLATATSDKQSKDPLQNGDYAWREYVLKPADLNPPASTPRPPMPTPAEGVFQQGALIYYRFSHAQLPHTSMGKIQKQFMQATLVPYWQGAIGGSGPGGSTWAAWVFGALAAAGAIYMFMKLKSPGPKSNPEEDDEEGDG
jgi:hypothetical protein